MTCETMRLKREASFKEEKSTVRREESFGSKKFEQGTKEQWSKYKELFQAYYKEKNPGKEPITYVSPQDLTENITTEEKAAVTRPRETIELQEFANYYDQQRKKLRTDIELEDGSTITVVDNRISYAVEERLQGSERTPDDPPLVTAFPDGTKMTFFYDKAIRENDLGPTEHAHPDNPFEYMPIVTVGESVKVALTQEFKHMEDRISSSPVKKVKFSFQDKDNYDSDEPTPDRTDGTAAEFPQVTVDLEQTWPQLTVDATQIWPEESSKQEKNQQQKQQGKMRRNQ